MAASLWGCRACQRRLLDSFVSFAGPSLAPSRAQALQGRSQLTRITRTLPGSASRNFQISARRPLDLQDEAQKDSTSNISEPSESSSPEFSPAPLQTSNSDSDTTIPWYLRVSTPPPLSPQNLPNPALQDIPPLPANPPAILQPILMHLSISTGLDALTILDLRDLTPPSALGSNLIMIIGTARSEKHLNTSADRFCRWIRSTYKLRPYADGLLGRNELKLKIRRRNKKLKLARSVGNTLYDAEKGYDDGITTGWICCNLGSVDSAELPQDENNEVVEEGRCTHENSADTVEQTPSEPYKIFSAKDQERPLEGEDEYSNSSDQEFVYRGFGSVSTSPKIVVQMFTEQKRAEMDLEGLWEARIKRRDEREEKKDRLFETSLIEEEIETPGVRRLDEVLQGKSGATMGTR